MAVSSQESCYLVIGPAGAGVQTALNAYASFQYLTLSKLPLTSIEAILLPLSHQNVPVAFSLQLLANHTGDEISAAIQQIRQYYPALKILQLDAEKHILAHRFLKEDTRHPFEQNASSGLDESILHEQSILSSASIQKDYSIDTSHITPKELAGKIAKVLGISVKTEPLQVYIKTFGFKYGAPTDAELVFDMRFITNPFYDESLRKMTGLDKPVKDYLFGLPDISDFFERWSTLIGDMLPMYHAQGKARITIAVGCTGGKHRSVCMGNALANYLQNRFSSFNVSVHHREKESWNASKSTEAAVCVTGESQAR